VPGRNLSRSPGRVAALVQQGDSLFGSSPFCRRVAPVFATFPTPFWQIEYTPAEVWRPLAAENLGRFYADFVDKPPFYLKICAVDLIYTLYRNYCGIMTY